MPPERSELRRKPRQKPGPYGPREKVKQTDQAATSTVVTTTRRKNLTLHDWVTVFSFMDLHPSMEQAAVVKHFATKADGALVFNQSTLSRKLQMRPQLEERVLSNPNALSSKRPRVVTRPDIEKALVLWFQGIERKGETVNGPMLQAKRRVFEDRFGVPEEERMLGNGWIASFCRAYALLVFD
jgi:Tc5 transposase DNA-binding domain